MVGQTRSKLKEAAPEPARSSRCAQPRRRRRATGAGEPEMDEPPAEAEKPQPPLPVGGGGNLPGGSRDYSPRRPRNLNPQNCMQMEVVAKTLLVGRFQFLGCLLEQLRDKLQQLRRRQVGSRTSVGIERAAFVGFLHWIHLVTLFENDRHFSHLSSLEREMTFRTEMGLYYSYFKTIIEAPSFLKGLWMIMNDRLTEYPLVINTVKRFHLYPEVIIAFWYRIFVGIMNLFGLETKTCWNVTRVEPLNEVQSCEGLGDPACFYVAVIFILNGIMMGLFFIYGAYLRGYPCNMISINLPVDFPFILGIILDAKLHNMVSVLLCFVLMFGNPMYLSSYYSSSLLMTLVIILKRNKIQRLGVSELNFWLIQGCAWLYHIRLSDLIAARILRYTDFDTLIYTCAPEFDFMEKATPLRYTKTLLLPRKQLLEHGEPDFSHIATVSIHCSCHFNYEAEVVFNTPHVCYGFLDMFSTGLFGWLFCRVRFENVIFGILAVMSIQGCTNLHNQWSIIGEFNNLPQEELIQWIKYNTRPDAVFAGAMPTMASVKLSTLHPIVNHPHYEDADLRTKPGCSMLEIWDVEDPSNTANPPLCSILLKDARPYFTTVFQNSMYRVLKVN
ncbi:Probable C-mannosyltransferase DPY19L2 [Vulpes lagopus]